MSTDQPASAQGALEGFRILVAEDTPASRLFLELALARQGARVTAVENGQQAVGAMLSPERFDCVLMDLRMPGMDGDEASRAIRAIEDSNQLKRTPIIAVTANAFEADRENCLMAGMDDFISKPVSLKILVPMVLKWVAAPGPR